jgi:hypothetical protein
MDEKLRTLRKMKRYFESIIINSNDLRTVLFKLAENKNNINNYFHFVQKLFYFFK